MGWPRGERGASRASDIFAGTCADAPQLAWRLALATSRPVDLHWDILRGRAVSTAAESHDNWTQLHLQLAIAGAGDTERLNYWRHDRSHLAPWSIFSLTREFAESLSAYAKGYFSQAGARMNALFPLIQNTGGSKAQNQLFSLIAESAVGVH